MSWQATWLSESRFAAGSWTRARGEAALRQSESQFRTVFESANDEIYIWDLEGRFLEVNGVACWNLGYSREELLQMCIEDIDASAGSYPARDLALMPAGQVFEAVHVRKDGALVPVEISARRFEFKGLPAILGVARDIAARKRVEAEMALRARSWSGPERRRRRPIAPRAIS